MLLISTLCQLLKITWNFMQTSLWTCEKLRETQLQLFWWVSTPSDTLGPFNNISTNSHFVVLHNSFKFRYYKDVWGYLRFPLVYFYIPHDLNNTNFGFGKTTNEDAIEFSCWFCAVRTVCSQTLCPTWNKILCLQGLNFFMTSIKMILIIQYNLD